MKLPLYSLDTEDGIWYVMRKAGRAAAKPILGYDNPRSAEDIVVALNLYASQEDRA